MKKIFTTACVAALSLGFSAFAGSSFTYTSVVPAEESAIEEGTEIVVKFGQAIERNTECNEAISITSLDDPDFSSYPYSEIGLNEDELIITFDLLFGGVAGNYYVVNIPADFVRAKASFRGNDPIQLYYTLADNGQLEEAPYMTWGSLITPEGYLNNPIWVGFNTSVTYNPLFNATFSDGTNTYTAEVTAMGDMATFRINELPEEIKTKGTYTLTIPAGMFITEGTELTNEEIVLTWEVIFEESGDDPYQPTGQPTVIPTEYYPSTDTPFVLGVDGTAFDIVMISLENPVYVNQTKVVTICSDELGSLPETCFVSYDEQMAEYFGPRVRVEFPEITTAGTYILVIPEATFVEEDGDFNPQLSVSFTVEKQATSDFDINELELVSVTPAEGTALPAFNEGDAITVVVNHPEEISEVNWSLYDTTDNDFVNMFSPDAVTRGENGEFIFTNGALDFTLYEGHNYQFRFEFFDNAHKSKVLTVNYVGSTVNNFKVSDVKIVSVDPVPGSDTFLTVENNSVVITFSDAVVFNQELSCVTEGGQLAAKAPVTGEATDFSNKSWKLYADKDFVAKNFGGFEFILSFSDEYGYCVMPTDEQMEENPFIFTQYNNETNEIDLFSLRYNCIEGGVTVDIDPADGSTVESLKDFTLTNPHTSSLNALDWAAVSLYPVILYNEAGEEVARGENYTRELAEGAEASDELNTKIFFSLNKEITADGTYTLVIPFEAITLGSEFSANGYKGQKVTYIVKAQDSVEGIFTENARVNVYNMQGMLVKKGATAADLRNLKGIYIVGGKKVVLK